MTTIPVLEHPKRHGRGKRTEHWLGKTKVKLEWSWSPNSVWNIGDGIYGYECHRLFEGDPETEHRYSGVVLIDRDKDWTLMAVIEGPYWKGIGDALEALGFTRPTLTASAVRERAA